MSSFKFLVMILFIFAVFWLWVIPGAKGQDTEPPMRAIRSLRKDLFKDYDTQERPVKNYTANVTINVSLALKRIYISDATNRNEIRMWVTLSWHDEFLTWNASEYNNVDQFRVPSSQIWMPDLAIYNSDADHTTMFSETDCIVNHWGRVLCVPTVVSPLNCNHDVAKWPFDTSVCHVTVGSWVHHGAQLDLQLYYAGFTTEGYVPNPEWQFLDMLVYKHVHHYPCCPGEPYVTLYYPIRLRRHAAMHATSVVVPAFVLAGISLVSFWVRDATLRTLTCLTTILGNYGFLLYLNAKISAHGDTIPNIVTYYRDALVMSSLGLCVALLSVRLEAVASPHWASWVVTWLRGRGGRPGQLLLGDMYEVSDKPEVESCVSPQGSSGCPAATVLDRFSFFTFGVTYIILLVALLP